MKFLLKDVNYDVRWERVWIKNSGKLLKFTNHEDFNATPKKRMVTKCIISSIDDSKTGKERFTPMVTGIAMQSKKDAPVKSLGRKYAFEKALAQMTLSKDERTALWSAFNNVSTIVK